VLETTFSAAGGGLVRVVDAISRDGRGPLGWTELAREIRADPGEVPMRWRVAPVTASAGHARGPGSTPVPAAAPL
jgi:hypothetical protein